LLSHLWFLSLKNAYHTDKRIILSASGIAAGFGTMLLLVAGVHQAGPSPTLDKQYSVRCHYNIETQK
jgi:hypothetical protein